MDSRTKEERRNIADVQINSFLFYQPSAFYFAAALQTTGMKIKIF
jgi:hypothetical protein